MVLAHALFILCTIATGCSVCLFVYVYLFTYICAVVFHLEKEGLQFLVCNRGTSKGRPSTVARCYTLEFDNAGFSSSDFLDKGIFFYISEHITTASGRFSGGVQMVLCPAHWHVDLLKPLNVSPENCTLPLLLYKTLPKSGLGLRRRDVSLISNILKTGTTK